MNFTFGTDPEFVLFLNEKAYSAIPIIKNSKDRRKKIDEYYYFYDNVLVECNIPVSRSKEEAISNIGNCLKKLACLVRPFKFKSQAACVFDKDQLTHEEAFKINCSEELCVYSMQQVEIDEEVFSKTDLRSAGGHIHLGQKMLHNGHNLYAAVRLLDLFLGIPSLFIDHDLTSMRRRELYGKAGRYRKPKYGIEYRSVGNFWLSSPKLVDLIYDICEFTLQFIADGRHNDLWKIDVEKLQNKESWMDPSFHPSQCHVCIGYDVNKLRFAIDNWDLNEGKFFMEFIKQYIPSSILSKIDDASVRTKIDEYKEWNI